MTNRYLGLPEDQRKKLNPQTQKEDASIRALHEWAESNSLIIQAEPKRDFGIDAYVEVTDGNYPTGFHIAVQLKAGQSYIVRETDTSISIRLDKADLVYWLAANLPVLVCFYEASTQKLFGRLVETAETATPDRSSFCLEFSKKEDMCTPSLAQKLRQLPAGTPNRLHRAELLQCEFLEIMPGASWSICKAPSELSVTDEAIQSESIPFTTGIWGASPDGKWVLEIHSVPLGQKCVETSARLLNLEHWVEQWFPIQTEEDIDAPQEQGTNIVQNRLRDLGNLIAQLKIFQIPEFLGKSYIGPDSDTTPRSLDLFVRAGSLEFLLELETRGIRTGLKLRSTNFKPSREAWLALEGLRPGKVYDPSTEGFFDRAKMWVGATAMYRSPAKDWTALVVYTNAEHGCWGNSSEEIHYIRDEELKDTCYKILL